MSKKGGYVIVDLKGQSITVGTPFTLDGVTARLNRAKNKACLLSGFAIGNDEKRDVFVDLQPTADGYAGTVGGYQITIEDDAITFSAVEGGLSVYKVSGKSTVTSLTVPANGAWTNLVSVHIPKTVGALNKITVCIEKVNVEYAGAPFSGFIGARINSISDHGYDYYTCSVEVYMYNKTATEFTKETATPNVTLSVISGVTDLTN